MNFEWGLFQFTMTDCKNLVRGLKATPTLRTLRITSSKMGEEEGRVLVKGLLEHPGLALLGIHVSSSENTCIYAYTCENACFFSASCMRQISPIINWVVELVVH